jgi:hypothetical protein
LNLLEWRVGQDRYVFLFEDSQRAELVKTLGRYAANPRLNFTWADAAIVAHRVNLSSPAPSADPNCPF